MQLLHLDANEIVVQGQRYRIRQIDWPDSLRQSEYQRLRAEIFVKQLGWNIPVDLFGRERDRYDQKASPTISVYCVYGIDSMHMEHLLGGVRIFQLRDWDGSMVVNEFHDAGMIPGRVLQLLENRYDCGELLELTRLCVQRGHWYIPPHVHDKSFPGFRCAVARDLTYASVYSVAGRTQRWCALALVDAGYLRVMKRSHFVFEEVYSQQRETRQGYALTIIDLPATIRSIREVGESERAERMMALCRSRIG